MGNSASVTKAADEASEKKTAGDSEGEEGGRRTGTDPQARARGAGVRASASGGAEGVEDLDSDDDSDLGERRGGPCHPIGGVGEVGEAGG